MSHGYSLRLIQLNREADDSNLGVRLGRTCIKHGVSVKEVAAKFGVSRQTVYNWFCGVHTPQNLDSINNMEQFVASLG